MQHSASPVTAIAAKSDLAAHRDFVHVPTNAHSGLSVGLAMAFLLSTTSALIAAY